MPLDLSIYQNLLAKPKTVAEYDAEAMQGQTNRLALQQGQMKADEYQRSVADGNKLRQVVSGFGDDAAANTNMLFKAGRLTEAQAYQKSNAEALAKTADVGKTKEETLKMQRESASHQFEIAGQLASAWATNPGITKAQIQAGLAAASHSGVISQEITQAKMTELENMADNPQVLNGWAKGTLQQVMKAKDSMSYIAPDAGQVLAAKTQVDTNAATNARVAAEGKANRGQAQEHFNATEARADKTAAAGKVPSGYRAGPDGTLVAIPGGPADQSNAKPSADYLKQAEAYQNMDDALTGYKKELAGFGGLDAINPTKRAAMGTAYQNTLLQAKEIYKLGVLNGGDERILKDIINSPLDLTSVAIPREALLKQANDLGAIIKRGNENLAKVNKQKAIPLPSTGAGGALVAPAAPPKNAKGWTLHTDAKGNQAYVSPDGKSFEEAK